MNRFGRLRKRSLLAASVGLVATAVVPTPAHAETPKAQSCVITVIGIDKNMNFITTPMKCYDTFSSSLASIGVNVPAGTTPLTVNMKAVTALSSVIGIHY